MPRNKALVGAAIIVLAVVSYIAWSNQPAPKPTGAAQPMVAVTVPALTGLAKMGEVAFNAKCAVCHGTNAAGQSGIAPPLIHRYYRPGHHADLAFLRAAQNGVTAHHWPFGNMPPVKGITPADVKSIVAYIRVLQKANGIF